ncbi:MAG: bifunctional sulfate adenylyltransferase/adenylylsulfate kinase [Anaerolineales bacterium]|nr:bifunctional sulfate adenylyltransferase/adenylylsulfate kinase [Anaerolineales bacterium]
MITTLNKPYGGRLILLLPDNADQAKERARRASRLPSLQLNARALCDLELLMSGGFSPLDGFMGAADYRSVLESMRLANGMLFPIPITLPVSADFSVGLDGEVALRDPRNNLLAILRVAERYRRDPETESLAVAGTRDMAHPLVSEMAGWGPDAISGPIEGIALPQHFSFTDLRLTPEQTRARLAEMGNPNVVAFQTRNPIHRAHEELTKRAAQETRSTLLLHPVVGLTKPGDIDAHARVRCYRAVAAGYFDPGQTLLSVLPLAMRMAGPKEAIWHAIIRRNFGANAFIVGRDHAGPGRDSAGRPYYAADAAQVLAQTHQDELGVKILPFEELVYNADTDAYIPSSQASGPGIRRISGTDVRERYLDAGLPLPKWFTRPEIASILAETNVARHHQGFCIWFTGLSGAGKSTIAEILVELLLAHGRQVTLLDGDVVRTHLSKGLGFSRADRDANVLRIGFVASEVTRHNGVALCAAVSPYETTRNQVRQLVGSERFVLIHVNTSLEVCETRDVKGLYAKARRGEVIGVTGIDDPYELPGSPDLVVDGATDEALTHALRVLELLQSRGLVRSTA